MREDNNKYIQAQVATLVKDRENQEQRVVAVEKEKDDLVQKYIALEEQVKQFKKTSRTPPRTQGIQYKTPVTTDSAKIPPHLNLAAKKKQNVNQPSSNGNMAKN